jgi:phosphoglycolate phosphatase-like HAD superfamily hydrolase
VKTLVIFDVDGTLLNARWTRQPGANESHFVTCFEEHFQVFGVPGHNEAYTHQTDSCWTVESYRLFFGRDPTREEIDSFWNHYLDRYEELAPMYVAVREVGGAADTMAELANCGAHVAIASGGLRRMQEYKLRAARLPFEGLPSSYCDNAYSREDIINAALELVREHRIERTIYVGDASWDVQACRNLGMPFIGVGHRGESLRQAGATHVLEDYTQPGAFMEALQACRAPV